MLSSRPKQAIAVYPHVSDHGMHITGALHDCRDLVFCAQLS